MSFFDFLHDCVEFLENVWNRFTSWLDSLIEKIINSIEKWLNSIFNLLREGFILITNGLINWVISKREVEIVKRKLGKKLGLKEITSEELLQEIKICSEVHEVPMTNEERRNWQQIVGNQEKIYTTY